LAPKKKGCKRTIGEKGFRELTGEPSFDARVSVLPRRSEEAGLACVVDDVAALKRTLIQLRFVNKLTGWRG
jgi:hypothetical protein